MQEAITAPSVDAAERETFVDHRIDPQTVEALDRIGHNVEVIPEPFTGGGFSRPRGVMIDPDLRPPPRWRTSLRSRRSPGLLETVNHDEDEPGC